MTYRDLLSESCFASSGIIRNEAEYELALRYLLYNKDFICQFPKILYSLTGDRDLVEKFELKIGEEIIHSNVDVIFTENLGHTFGTFLIESRIFEYLAFSDDIKWVWKFSNDIICTDGIFDNAREDAEFYYINNIGYNCFLSENRTQISLFNAIKDKSYFYPQTNYYIIKNGIEFYPDEQTIFKLKEQYEKIREVTPSIMPWFAIPGCDCETMLRKTVELNKLKTSHMLNDEELLKIIYHIYTSREHDGSHKNIAYARLGNLCHFPHVDSDILQI